MGSGPDYPKPEKEEKALQTAQAGLLGDQRALLQKQFQSQELLAPYLYKQLGLKPTYGEGGEQTGFEDLAPTPEQEAAKVQLSAFQEQLRLQQILQPHLLKQQGFTPQYDAEGKIVGLTENPAPVNPNQAEIDKNQSLQRGVERSFLERTQQALAGNLPVDPTLQRNLSTSEDALREELRKNLGPGYATSTPGSQSLADFEKRRQELLYSAARGEVSQSGQFSLANNQAGLANQQAAFGNQFTQGQAQFGNLLNSSSAANNTALLLQPFAALGTTPARLQGVNNVVGAQYQGSGALGSLASLYGQAQGPYALQRNNSYQADVSQFQNSPLNRYVYKPTENAFQEFGKSFGSLGGAASGGGFG